MKLGYQNCVIVLSTKAEINNTPTMGYTVATATWDVKNTLFFNV